MSIGKSELQYWDQQRANLAAYPELELNAYRGMKALAIAHKRALKKLEMQQEIAELEEILELQEGYKQEIAEHLELMRFMRKAGYEMPNSFKAFEESLIPEAEERIKQLLKEIEAIGSYFPNIGYPFSIPIDPSMKSMEAREAISGLLKGKKDQIASNGLIALAMKQLNIKAYNAKLNAKIRDYKLALKLASDPSAKIEIQAAIKAKQDQIIPQAFLSWEGIEKDKEIAKSAALASELLGAGLQDALMDAHGIRNAARSKAERLLDQFALNKMGAMGELIASSFPGSPQAADLIQEGFLKLAIKQAKQEESLSLDSGLLTLAMGQQWADQKKWARAEKRDRTGHMLGIPMGPASDPHKEAIPDPLEALDNQGIWELAEKCCTEKQLAAIRLCYRDEYSHRQAAAILGCEKKTLLQHLKAAEKRLAKALLA